MPKTRSNKPKKRLASNDEVATIPPQPKRVRARAKTAGKGVVLPPKSNKPAPVVMLKIVSDPVDDVFYSSDSDTLDEPIIADEQAEFEAKTSATVGNEPSANLPGTAFDKKVEKVDEKGGGNSSGGECNEGHYDDFYSALGLEFIKRYEKLAGDGGSKQEISDGDKFLRASALKCSHQRRNKPKVETAPAGAGDEKLAEKPQEGDTSNTGKTDGNNNWSSWFGYFTRFFRG